MASYLHAEYCCATSSGTASLHLALKILGIGKGDYVLCPIMTFAATANAILYENAKPVFIDVNKENWTNSRLKKL